MTDLIQILNSTGKWWNIGRGKFEESDDTSYWCQIQEPCVLGKQFAFVEGDDLSDCVVQAIVESESCTSK